MIILLAMIFAIIAVPTVVEAIAHPKENLLRSTGQAVEEAVIKPIENALIKPWERYIEKRIAEVEDFALRALLRSMFTSFTKLFEVIRNIFKP